MDRGPAYLKFGPSMKVFHLDPKIAAPTLNQYTDLFFLISRRESHTASAQILFAIIMQSAFFNDKLC